MTLEQLILEYGYIILFIGTFIEGETTIILAGIAAYQGYLDLWLVILVSFLGGIAGDQTFFILGRIYGKPFIEKRPHWKVPAKKVNTLLEKHKHLVLISFRFFYGFRTVTPFVIGASHLSTTYVVTMNFIGATFWAVSMGIASFYFGKTIEMVVHSVYQYQKWVFLSVIIIASIIWLIHFYNIRRVRKEKEQQHCMNTTAFSYFIFFAIIGVQTTYLPNYYIKYHGFTGKNISVMFAGNMLLGIFSHVVWGQIADYTRRSALLLRICSLCILLLYFLLAMIHNMWVIAALFWSLGFFMTAMPALLDTIAITNYPIERYGSIRLWGSVGYGGIVFITPFILPSDHSPLIYISILAALYCFGLIFIREEKREKSLNSEKKILVITLLKIPGILPFLLFSFLHWCAHISYNLCLDVHRDLLGLPYYLTGVAICTGISCEIFCMARVSEWFKKIPSYKTWFMLIAATSALRWVSMGYPLNTWEFICIQILQGLTFGTFFTISIMYLQTIVPRDMLTSGQNIFYITTFSLGGFVGTFLCGTMLDSSGKGFYVFLCAAMISLLSLIQSLFLKKTTRK